MRARLLICIGPQGSGKSTWCEDYIKTNTDVLYLSTDKMRIQFGTGMGDQTVNELIYSNIKTITNTSLLEGKSVLLDATFIKKSWREDYIKIGRSNNARLIAHVFRAKFDILKQRVSERVKSGGLFVPDNVIDKYVKMYQPPTSDEFDEIYFHD
jgi:predicted kinase